MLYKNLKSEKVLIIEVMIKLNIYLKDGLLNLK